MAESQSHKLRVMVDANVLVAGTIWRRFPYQVLRHAAVGDYQLVLTQYLLDEARRHINRLKPDVMSDFEVTLESSNFLLVPSPTAAQAAANHYLVRDVNDVPVVLAAINAGVDYLISQDKDITDPAQSVHERLKVMLPGTFLREHMGWSSEALERVRTAE